MIQEIPEPITIEFAVAPGDMERCHAIRRAVFVDEQGIDPELEFDGSDDRTQSLLAYCGRTAVGTARIALDAPNIKLGRVAVLSPWRGRGIGRAMVETAVEFAANRGVAAVILHSQTSVVDFYEKLGFVVEGDEYFEAGIPHRTMRLTLARGKK